MRKLIVVILGLTLIACQPAAFKPALPELANTWQQPNIGALDSLEKQWWQQFNNPELSTLIEQSLQQNLTLAQASQRLEQARLAITVSHSSIWPTLDTQFSAGRQGRIKAHTQGAQNNLALGFNASYELDLWRKNAQELRASEAEFAAQQAMLKSTQLSLTHQVASAWLMQVALVERTKIAAQNIGSAEQLLSLVESQVQAGAKSPVELAQQRALLASQQRQQAAIQQALQSNHIRLTRLLGTSRLPDVPSTTLNNVQWPAVSAGLPTDLITRRPDIAQAEAKLAQADAQVHIARAAMLPSVRFTAEINSSHNRASQLLQDPIYSLASALTAPIFNAGKLSALHQTAQLERQILLLNYQQTIIDAVLDVESVLADIAGIQAQYQAQQQELRQAQLALELATARYQAGAETANILLDTQRQLYAAQDQQVQLKMAYLQASLDLYKALGGGW